MNDLRDAPIEVYVDDVIWTIEVSLYRGVADMAAQKALFGVPRWSSKFGCSKCYIAGQRVGSQRKWIATQEDDLSLRQPDSYVADGRLGRNGVPNLFGGECKFPDLRLDGESIEAVKKTLREMSSYTYSNAFILSLEDLRTSKAAELDEIAFVVFPLTAAVGVIPSPIVAASLLGYWLCVRIVSRSRSLTTTAIRNAQELARLTKNLWTSIAPQVFTMKCHVSQTLVTCTMTKHSMREEIECYGSVYQWSSAPFESHHRRLQIRVDQATTNSSKLIIERCL
ncbi:hypothetical protein ANCCAN_12148 [Ancylostoma caninum]|uniref:Uncharacterized protein n=1 Tax=Ancylostoma caninum TaxID=29170 RepID=A0A368GFU4_ANCCA|nr:hypothetical protein ANCCAN_12148 [Ancylostoma caninum]